MARPEVVGDPAAFRAAARGYAALEPVARAAARRNSADFSAGFAWLTAR